MAHRPHLLVFFLLAAFLTGPLGAQSSTVHRVTLSAGEGKDLPYSIEVPRDWTMRQEPGYPGLFIGPADAKPEDPRLIWVRGSKVAMADPAQVVASIKASDAKSEEWSAPRLEEREIGGIKALLVRLDTKNGDAIRSTLILKVPLGEAGLDIVASAEKSELDKRLRDYERTLLSVRPVVPPATSAAPAPAPPTPPAPKKE